MLLICNTVLMYPSQTYKLHPYTQAEHNYTQYNNYTHFPKSRSLWSCSLVQQHIILEAAIFNNWPSIIGKQSFCTTLQLMVMHHHTKFGYKTFGSYDLNKHALNFWSFCLTKILNTAFQSFHWTFGIWWCPNKLNLVAKGLAVQMKE